jgi:DNA-binding LacI/PurR family transcriptional regulator
MPVTIKDIARELNISHSTVSRALNGNPLIPESTAKIIRKTAAEMGYLHSAAARSLKTNRSQALGVIVTNIDDPFFGEILQGIEEVAQENGYSLFMASSQHDSEKEKHIVQVMRERRVDGVIICSALFSAEQSRQFAKYGIPIVTVNNQSAEIYRYSIYHDDIDGSRQLTNHLIELGHTRIAYIGNGSAGRTNIDRATGFEGMMKDHNLEVLPGYMVTVDGNHPEKGLAGANTLLALPKPPSAIMCYNDMIATGVLKAVFNAGLRVPEDISVTGFDNIVFSAFTRPALTTFDQPKHFIGAEAAHLLLKLLDSTENPNPENEHFVRTLKGKLLMRQSTSSYNPHFTRKS